MVMFNFTCHLLTVYIQNKGISKQSQMIVVKMVKENRPVLGLKQM